MAVSQTNAEVVPVIINAATGRMGRELIKAAFSDAGSDISAALARAEHPLLGTDLGYLIGANPQGVFISSDLSAALSEQAVLIDFSLPAHSIQSLKQAVASKTPMVIGTTGFSEEQQQFIEQASQSIPILQAANFSIGVNLLIKLAKQATETVGEDADIEIFEAHHKYKMDAPSGTALAIGDAIAEQKGELLSELAAESHQGGRKDGSIGFSVMRAGEIVGDHEVVFALDGEILSLKHHAQSRQCFAQGAIKAAKWLAKQSQSGLYSLQNVI